MTPERVMIHPVRIPFLVPAPSGPVSRFVLSFIISTSESILLVDAGVSGSEHHIFEQIRKTGRKPEDVSTIILTHSHPDHIGGAKAIREVTGCTIAAHPLEKAWIEDTKLQEKERPVPGFTQLVGGAVNVDRLISDGDIITLGEGRFLEVIHTPGHSPGSISLLMRPEMAIGARDSRPTALSKVLDWVVGTPWTPAPISFSPSPATPWGRSTRSCTRSFAAASSPPSA